MRRSILLGILSLVLISAAIVAVAQPPAPPATPPIVPTVPAPKGTGFLPATPVEPPASTTRDPATLARFDPLVAFPEQTQAAVRAVLLGASWMTRMNQAQGRFLYGYNPALRQPMPGDHDLKQARAALALAQAARFTGDEKQRALASQAALALLSATKPDPADANCRVPVHSSFVCNRVGFASVLALAVYELPAPDASLLAEAEKLCEFLRRQVRTDGSIHYTDGPSDVPTQIDPRGLHEYPGLALQAIAVSNRHKPAAWKSDVVNKGIAHYRAVFRAHPHPLLATTLTPACAEQYLQSKSADAAAACFEMNDWLYGLQIRADDKRAPQWAGGFRSVVNNQVVDEPAGPETGLYVKSFACAYQITRHTPDLTREARYKGALVDACHFVCGMQYLEANTRHFENAFRANMLIGGFYLAPNDGNLRIDATATAISGLLAYLSSGAEK